MLTFVRTIMVLSVATLIVGFITTHTSRHALQAAEVYKWVDAEGLVHYSDKPFQEGEKLKVSLTGGKPPVELPTSTQARVLDVANAKQVAQECKMARENLAAIASQNRILGVDAQGNEVELGAAEKALEQEKNQTFVDKFCNANTNANANVQSAQQELEDEEYVEDEYVESDDEDLNF